MTEVRNTIELNIYDDELEIVKTFRTYGIKWKAFKKIMADKDELSKLKSAEDEEAIEKMNDVVRLVFPAITDEELDEAFVGDVFNCFKQAMTIADNMAKNS